MAVSLFSHDVSDLCLGKPALRLLSLSATVADALTALKFSDDYFVSVWDCRLTKNGCGGGDVDGSADGGEFECCRCVGKLCMVDVICYLCRDQNLLSPSAALCAPISEILPQIPGIVMHLEPSASLLDAIDLVLQGAQNLVVPIKAKLGSNSRRKQLKTPKNAIHGGREFCWLTQEDIIRYLLSSIGHFSPIAALSLDNLGIICTNPLSVNYHSPASSAIGAISHCIANQTSVAVVHFLSFQTAPAEPFHFSFFFSLRPCESRATPPPVSAMFRRASTLLTRPLLSARARSFSADLPAASSTDDAFVAAWKKAIPTIDPPRTPLFFMAPRPATPSSIPTKLTVNFVLPYASELSAKEVDMVIIPATTGQMGVLPGHVATIAELKPGVLSVHEGSDTKKYFVSSGFAFIHGNSYADIIAVEAVPVDQIDPDQVQKGLAEFTQKLNSASTDLEKAEAQIGVDVHSALNAALTG